MGKGKVHPSPSPAAAAAAGGGGGGEMTAEAVLMRLLPAAVLAAAAPLGAEGKEVLAYLVLASLRSSAPPTPVDAGRGGAAAQQPQHRPELACGCFGCYTAYWSRWNGSPEADREAIHRAIEAFEEHLSRKEEEKAGVGKGRRGRKKRAAAAAKDKSSKGKELAVDPTPPPPAILPVSEVAAEVDDASCEDAKTEADVEEGATTSAAGEEAGSGGEEEKRRRGWGAVLNWRGWGLWGSH